MIRFSATFLPTTLFSLRDSNSTSSGAKSVLLPSPYSIKMALLNQAITVGNELETLSGKKSQTFSWVRDTKIYYYIPDSVSFCVNNTFIKILKPSRSGTGFQETVSFREYVQINQAIELILEVPSESAKAFWMRYLHKINYFGKRGCFFQFLNYNEVHNEPNVKEFKAVDNLTGIIQQYDDFDSKADFDSVSSYNRASTKRKQDLLVVPVVVKRSSRSYTHYLKS